MRTGLPEGESASEMSALIPLMLDSTLHWEIASSKRGTWYREVNLPTQISGRSIKVEKSDSFFKNKKQVSTTNKVCMPVCGADYFPSDL